MELGKPTYITLHEADPTCVIWGHVHGYTGTRSGDVLEITKAGDSKYVVTRTESCHVFSVVDLCVSPDDSQIVTTSLDGVCMIWDSQFSQEESREVLRLGAGAPHIALGGGGDFLVVTGRPGQVVIESLRGEDHDQREQSFGSDTFMNVRVLGDSIFLQARHSLVEVDVLTMQQASAVPFQAMPRPLHTIAVDAATGLVLAGTVGGYLIFYDVRAGATIAELRMGAELVESVVVGDGYVVAGLSNGKLLLVDTASKKTIAEATPHRKRVRGMALGPSGVVSVSEDCSVALIDVLEAATDG